MVEQPSTTDDPVAQASAAPWLIEVDAASGTARWAASGTEQSQAHVEVAADPDGD